MNLHSDALKMWKAAFMADQTEAALGLQTDYKSPGKNFKCPFHSEQSGASMKYYPATQTMHCFGKCGRSFNAFDLLALQRGIQPEDSAAVWKNVIAPLWTAHAQGSGISTPARCAAKSPRPTTSRPPKAQLSPAQEYAPDTPPPVCLPGFGKPTAVYRYTPSFFVYRKDGTQADGARRKDIRPVHWTPQAGWKTGDPHGLLPLYGLDRIRKNPCLPVLVVEGEKAAEAARLFVNREYVVTAWAHGANAVHKTDWAPLFGRLVLIWPDHDTPGINAAYDIGEVLEGAGSDSLLFAPTGPRESGQDAADFLQTCEGNPSEAYDHFKMLNREFQHSCEIKDYDNE